MKTILIHPEVKGVDVFKSIISKKLPEFNIVTSVNKAQKKEVEVLIFWLKVPSYLGSFPNLKLILSCGSGIDHFINKVKLPSYATLVRLVDPYLRFRVANYVLNQIIFSFSNSIPLGGLSEDCEHNKNLIKDRKIKVGIMGLGLIGLTIARTLKENGFITSGWVKSGKKKLVEDIYYGENELYKFVKNIDVLVCQLPLTSETKGILNKNLFNQLKNGVLLINTGRGEHLEEIDLLKAIEYGKISGACLDVIKNNPLPKSHPFFSNPKIKITPHIAGYVGPETQAPYACKIIKSYFSNKKLEGIVNIKNEY